MLLPEVLGELKPRSTEFANWLREHGKAYYPPETQMPVAAAYTEVNRVLRDPDLGPGSVGEFKRGADYHLVAWALAGNHRVVTFEERANRNRRPRAAKIPDICDALGIDCTNLFQMLSDHGARFIQQP